MSSLKYCKPSNAGFSLIEIMVGMVMGLISMVIVMQVFATFEGQKRTTTSGSDAQTNGGVGLYTIERDIRMAGYGFADAIGCTVNTAQPTLINSTLAVSSFVLAPVTIIQGVGGLPDTISVMASNKQNWSVPVRNVTDHSLNPGLFHVSTIIGMAQNDLLIAYETDNAGTLVKTCTLVQVSNAAPIIDPVVNNPGSWNAPAIFPAADYTVNAMLLNVGSLMVHYYSLDANSNLITMAYDSTTNTGLDVVNDPAQILSPDVVNLQAQYGFDTRSNANIPNVCFPTGSGLGFTPPVGVNASGQCSIVDTWSDNPPVDISRIYAIRFAVVARSGLKEKPDQTTGICNTTTTSPTWARDSTNPAGIVIDVSKNPNGQYPKKDDGITPDPNEWKCYRYKTFETIVPLRNAIWKQR
jgi:type IV pilus assembly protein PilW